jgi:hypothetical protein
MKHIGAEKCLSSERECREIMISVAKKLAQFVGMFFIACNPTCS